MPVSFGNWVAALVVIAVAYVIGSIPFGVIVGTMRGVDLTRVGSGNIGATNAYRGLGAGWGFLVFFLDFVKGLVPVLVAKDWFSGQSVTICLIATALIVGHVWSCFLGFRGGKGIATGGAAVLAVSPLAGILTIAVWIIVLVLYRYVSVASLAATVSVGFWLGMQPDYGGFYVVWAFFLVLLTLYTHRDNLARLTTRTEPKIGRP
ncbi:MAG: glycerol-3-phosphate 1-O-acyltransferase PlsY [Armatimonadia bacterium]|nr:glycerol-3-phosphate 1-O-acyltransferase PlsY [Armatimonadia bacterium]